MSIEAVFILCGGMAGGGTKLCRNKDFNEVRYIQKRILEAYEQDFSKHAPNEIVPRLRMLWNSIPSQLAKENKKFIYVAIGCSFHDSTGNDRHKLRRKHKKKKLIQTLFCQRYIE